MTGFKIFSTNRVFINNLFSAIYLNSFCLPLKPIVLNKKNDEVDYRFEEFKGKLTTGTIGWHCFKTNKDAITYLNNLPWFIYDKFQYAIYACDIENIYCERNYDFNTSGFTCQFIIPHTLTFKFE